MSDEIIKPPTINNNSLAPTLEYTGKRMSVKFNGSCLIKQDQFIFNNRKTVSIYNVYEIDSNLDNFDTTLENCEFGGSMAQNAVIFEADMSNLYTLIIGQKYFNSW